MRAKKSFSSVESFALNTLKEGKVFYTELPDKDITARASHYGVKVRTQRIVVVGSDDGGRPTADNMTKVTIVNRLNGSKESEQGVEMVSNSGHPQVSQTLTDH